MIKIEIVIPIIDITKWKHEKTFKLLIFTKRKSARHEKINKNESRLFKCNLKFLLFILSMTIINPFHLSVNSLTETVIGLLFPVSTIIFSGFNKYERTKPFWLLFLTDAI